MAQNARAGGYFTVVAHYGVVVHCRTCVQQHSLAQAGRGRYQRVLHNIETIPQQCERARNSR